MDVQAGDRSGGASGVQVVRDSSDPQWQPMEMALGQFNLGDLDGEIVIEVGGGRVSWPAVVSGGEGHSWLSHQ